jgi:hypothetical protein
MSWFKELFAPAKTTAKNAAEVKVVGSPKIELAEQSDSTRHALEQQIRVYLEAARYLATCGRFNEEKFDQVESILSEVPTGSMDSAKRAELKEHVKHLLPDHGLSPWDQVKIREHQSLSVAVGTFAKLLLELRPDERSREFIKWSRDQIREIESLIQKSD